MADLIDRSKIDLEGNVLYDMGGLMFCNEVQEYLDGLPTVDAVEVVRCKDCKYYHTRPLDYDACFFGTVPVYKEPEDFCSDGKRKEEENNGRNIF